MLHHEKRRPNPNRREIRARRTLEALRMALEMYPTLMHPGPFRTARRAN